jgi:CheY-like chemotaxis protein
VYSVYSVVTPSSSVVTLHFEVRDTGVGIPVETQRRIFEAFAQADTSTTRKYGGTGLGLTISSRLVEMMGGRIWVESEVGKGSTFHFTAQLGLASDPASRPLRAAPEQLHEMAALVVDDNATNRRFLQELLGSWGLKPTAVDSGRAALAALKQAAADGKPFPLVLLDGQMPQMDGFTVAEQILGSAEMGRGVTVVMLTSAGQPEDVARCRKLGVAGHLMKPVKPSELQDALLAALGRQTRGEEAPAGRAAPCAGHRSLRVLLAEDNPVNQKLAIRLLEKQGHTAVLVGNGREALEALERQSFDLVLMDVEMPEMGGLETAAAIREKEQGTGRHVPIVAMTAHAMKGDRERCLTAGMDGYLTKPIQVQELFAALAGFAGTAQTKTAAAPALAADEVLDVTEALARVAGDMALLGELRELFLATCPDQLAALREAIARDDGRAVQRVAHTLKGAVGSFGARVAFAAAQRLETMGREGNLTAAEGAYVALEESIACLKPALAALGEPAEKG